MGPLYREISLLRQGCTTRSVAPIGEGARFANGASSLWEMQNGRCFYDESHDMASPEVDHVLPWSFVLEDRTWNLVLACRKCNNEKRDRLTSMDALERLCARNKAIADGHRRIPSFFGTLRNGIRVICRATSKDSMIRLLLTAFHFGQSALALIAE